MDEREPVRLVPTGCPSRPPLFLCTDRAPLPRLYLSPTTDTAATSVRAASGAPAARGLRPEREHLLRVPLLHPSHEEGGGIRRAGHQGARAGARGDGKQPHGARARSVPFFSEHRNASPLALREGGRGKEPPLPSSLPYPPHTSPPPSGDSNDCCRILPEGGSPLVYLHLRGQPPPVYHRACAQYARLLILRLPPSLPPFSRR